MFNSIIKNYKNTVFAASRYSSSNLFNANASSGLTGGQVALSKNGYTAVVGSSTTSGGLYVYRREGSIWTQEGSFSLSSGDYTRTLSISDDGTAFIYGNVSNNTNTGYINFYTKQLGTWGLRQTINGPSTNSNFGTPSISGDGNCLVVGAGGVGGVGTVYFYTRSGASWVSQGTIAPPSVSSPAYNYEFGCSVALDYTGENLVIGDKGYSTGTGGFWGRIHFYTRSGTTWTLRNTFTGESTVNYFGCGVNITSDGTTAVAASVNPNSPYTCYAKTYTRNGTTWSLQQKINLTDIRFDHWRGACAFSGNGKVLALGLVFGTLNSKTGGVPIYYLENGTWVNKITLQGDVTGDAFGGAVALDQKGKMILIGWERCAANSIANSGCARVYYRK